MNFSESTAYLFSLGNEVEAMKLGLDNITTLLEALGNPQTKYLKVQVAGTNGKGSVCAFLDSICRAAGIRVGLYTSPHLVSITERVKINGEDISEEKFCELASQLRETAEQLVADSRLGYPPTFFEQMTAIALLAFAEAKVELAILETGLGGRLDAVTAARAEIAAITRIDYDHQEYLGQTIEEIAAEKAAIIHAQSRVVIGDNIPQVTDIILAKCAEFGIEAHTECSVGVEELDRDTRSMVVTAHTRNEVYEATTLGLLGRHQAENARTAILAAEALEPHLWINTENVIDGLSAARHPGRLEYIDNVLLDGAHNMGGAKAVAEYIREFESRPITIVFGAMREKDVAEITSILFPLAERIIVTEPSNTRSLSYEEILETMPADISRLSMFATNSVSNAMEIARAITPDDGLILVTGSLYLVGEVRGMIGGPKKQSKS